MKNLEFKEIFLDYMFNEKTNISGSIMPHSIWRHMNSILFFGPFAVHLKIRAKILDDDWGMREKYKS